MLHLYEFALTFPQDQKVHPSMGSIFQGALIEKLPSEVATAFHETGMRPYSQAVFWKRETGQAVWRLGLLNDATAAVFKDALNEVDHLYLKQKGYDVQLSLVTHQQFEAESYLRPDSPRPVKAKIHFWTTTSFKRSGVHVLFPETVLLYQSVAQRWPFFSPVMLEENIASVLDYYTIIQDYDLRTNVFQLEGHGVKGFSGSLTLRFGGNDSIRHLAAALLSCGTFTGFGVKTAIGMGAASVEIISAHKGGMHNG